MKDKLEKVLSSSTLPIIITMHNCTNLNHFKNHWFIIALDANLPPQPHSRVSIMRKEHNDLTIVLQYQFQKKRLFIKKDRV
jgi:hypothetical protein